MDFLEVGRLHSATTVCVPNDAHPETKTIAMCIVAGILFVGLLCFCLYIFCKYIVIKQNWNQKSMVIFYSLCMIDILSRIVFLVVSCFVLQTQVIIFYISSCSSILSIAVGVSHSQNLSRVVLDLAALRKETQEEQL